jgi:hypothetical protein
MLDMNIAYGLVTGNATMVFDGDFTEEEMIIINSNKRKRKKIKRTKLKKKVKYD